MAELSDHDLKDLLFSVLGNMDQGVLVVRDDLSVPLLNLRATELIDLPASFADNPPNFRDILAYQVQTGAITEAYRVSKINDFILHGTAIERTQTYTRQTRTGRWLDVRTTPLPGGGFVRTFTDQTERHELAAQKSQSENDYRALFDNAAVGIYRSSVDGKQLRANPELVTLNGYHSEDDLLRGVKDIAKEWYVDPTRRDEFKRLMDRDDRVTEFESEVYRHLTRERIWVSETAWAVRDHTGKVVGYEGTVADITERKRAESRIAHAAHHDALTGLPNRMSFEQVMEETLAASQSVHLAYMDLDGFKLINDRHGHKCGDALLQALAKRFRNAVRENDTVFRMGGDELALLLPDTDRTQAEFTLDRVVASLERPFSVDGVRVSVGISIGLVHCAHGQHASDLLHLADIGLYQAKAMTGNAVCFVEGEAPENLQSRARSG